MWLSKILSLHTLLKLTALPASLGFCFNSLLKSAFYILPSVSRTLKTIFRTRWIIVRILKTIPRTLRTVVRTLKMIFRTLRTVVRILKTIFRTQQTIVRTIKVIFRTLKTVHRTLKSTVTCLFFMFWVVVRNFYTSKNIQIQKKGLQSYLPVSTTTERGLGNPARGKCPNTIILKNPF